MEDLGEIADDFIRSVEDMIRRVEDLTNSVDDLMESVRPFSEVELTFDNVYRTELVEGEDMKSHMKKVIVLDDEEVCSICLQDMNGGGGGGVDNDAVVLKCWHTFHEKCTLEWSKRKPNCPLCRHDMRKENIKRKRLSHQDDEELKGKTSTRRRT
ncbi:hypothetical protein MKX01_007163 [Papaver californicum]|nr:hypothetical protein MKX01_007163 [Papaver californicum]